MSYNNIEVLWRSPHNQPSPEQLEEGRKQFLARLRGRYRGFVVYFSFVLTALTVLTVWLGVRWMTKGVFDPSRVFPALGLLALPWIAAIAFVRRYRQHRRRHPDYGQSIAAALKAALDENRASMARATGILRLHAISIPLLALCMWQLHANGMTRTHEAISMAVFFGGIVVVSVGWVGLVCLRKLRQERRTIDDVIRTYE